MICKFTFLLACLNVSVIAPRTSKYFPGESSVSNINQQEYLEELYDVEAVERLKYSPTLDEKEVDFDENDMELLTKECYLDKNCLNRKKASVKKFQQKMQAIQCIHGLFVLNVLDELVRIIRRSHGIRQLQDELRVPVLRHQNYLKNMMSLLNKAQWDAYAWQIQMFTIVEALTALDANFRLYKEYIPPNYESIREKPLAFVRQCVQQKYLMSRGMDTTSETVMISRLVNGVYAQMELLYRNGVFENGNLELYTVRNLMLWNLYKCHECFFSWSTYNYKFDTSKVKRQLRNHAALYTPQQLIHKWELDPIGGNKYNALISKCILLRLVHSVWLHLHIYHTVKSRTTDVHDEYLHQMWNTLVPTLKKVLRLYRFEENIYWSAMHIMMDDLENISKEVLAAREEYSRIYFCHAAADLRLASASDIDRMLNGVVVSEDLDDLYDQIKDNTDTLDAYIGTLGYKLQPLNGMFVRIIVNAGGNEKFFMH